ncbi:hypothetical protein [Vibrio diazotrophicus]|uniref:hypothetical protein n=1 Tax=Vibrio diazotrophicus TaxID=685 RepID=UPI00034276AA|nr:hypothetical protein [Vibrio diazotrophicus]AGN34157.1 hypothetical protein VPPG_00032 [Vibrio phage VD1]
MGRIALKRIYENHQWHWVKVVGNEKTEITRDEMADLFLAKLIYLSAIYGGTHG